MTDRWTAADAHGILRAPTDSDDKYSRGVVGMRTGSRGYPGAAVLGVEAAWRTGAGMVRYLGPDRPTRLVLSRRPETVTMDGGVQAWVIGSGMDADQRSDEVTRALREVLAGDVPVVVDAGALDLVAEATAACVVTPHAREHDRLRAMIGLENVPPDADDAQREVAAMQTASTLGATVLLKGAVTIIATPGGWAAHVGSGTPWLATAGTGDVLAGVIGAVAAAAEADVEQLGRCAAAGAWLHGRAATTAAENVGAGADGTGPITALDVAEALPRAVAEALAAF